MLARAKLHILAKEFIQVNTGFKWVFLQGCSRTKTFLGSFRGKIDVLRMIGSFLDISSTAVVNRVRQVVDLIQSVLCENHDEQGFHPRYT